MEKVGPINNPKEREHYTLKRCCATCKHKRSKAPVWPFNISWCAKLKKRLIHDLHYDTGCKSHVAYATPEENKEWRLRLKEILRNYEQRDIGKGKRA